VSKRTAVRVASTVVELAGVGMAFEGSCGWQEVLRSRLDAFTTGAAPQWRVSLLTRGSLPADLPSPLAIRQEASRVVGSGEAFTVIGETFTAEVDLAARRARVEGPEAAYPVDALLRHLLPLMVDDGVVVHGVMLGADGRCWVSSGPSGSGKSTLARLLPERAFCDELVALRRGPAGWEARALPFWEGRPGRGRLEALCMLRHGSSHTRRPISPGRLVRELLEQMLWPLHDPAATVGCFQRLGDLAAEVPAFELEFAPRADVWPILSGEGSP